MRQEMLYLSVAMCLIFFGVWQTVSFAESSDTYCRDQLLKREEALRQAKAAVQLKLNRMYERMNKMKMRISELESGLTQIDNRLHGVGQAIVAIDKW